MPNTIQIKRRTTGSGLTGVTLAEGELFWQDIDKQLLIKQADGAIKPIGGTGDASNTGFVITDSTSQKVSGTKTFDGTLDVTGSLKIGGVKVDADASELNKLDGFNGTTAELNYVSSVVAGTAAASKALVLDGSKKVSLQGGLISTSAAPVAQEDLANKKYVDDVAQGLDIKASVHVATATALPSCTYSNGSSGEGATLTADANGSLTVDGHQVAQNEYVLVKNQSAALQNGIYRVVTAGLADSEGVTGAPFQLVRRVDADTSLELTSGSFVFVEQGTANASTGWVVSTSGSLTIGVTAISWTQFSSAGIADAGDGLQKTGTTFAVKTASSQRIAVSSSGIDLASLTQGTAVTKIGFEVDAYGRVTNSANSIQPSAGITIDCGVVN